MYSLVMNVFSCDFLKMHLQCTLHYALAYVLQLHSTWFLDGRTLILVLQPGYFCLAYQ